MIEVKQLQCLSPGSPARLTVGGGQLKDPGRGQILVRVEATSVNPIDVKRSQGYGRRLLALKGAAHFPMVLGNDLAGVVQAVGPHEAGWRVGDRVYGLLPTGRQGAHATHVLTQAQHLRLSPAAYTSDALATLPYTFTTLWLSLKHLGLNPGNAKGKNVLIHGASGGLGLLALQTLTRWGARVTAVCGTDNVQTCLAFGANQVLDRIKQPVSGLPAIYDASLNFAAWHDEAALLSRLKPGAMGHATTVHPLLASFDELGWIKGAWSARQAWSAMRKLAASKGAHTNYAWVIFQPNMEALDALSDLVAAHALHLPIGMSVPLAKGRRAFAHVSQQRKGRAILQPG